MDNAIEKNIYSKNKRNWILYKMICAKLCQMIQSLRKQSYINITSFSSFSHNIDNKLHFPVSEE